jgi:hypothetical protein
VPDLQPIAVALDLVDPVQPGQHLVSLGRDAWRDIAVSTAGSRWWHGCRLPTRNHPGESPQ